MQWQPSSPGPCLSNFSKWNFRLVLRISDIDLYFQTWVKIQLIKVIRLSHSWLFKMAPAVSQMLGVATSGQRHMQTFQERENVLETFDDFQPLRDIVSAVTPSQPD